MSFKQRQADRRAEEVGRGARHRHDRLLPSRLDDLSEGRVRSRADPRAPRGRRATSTRACKVTFENEATAKKEVFQHDEGLVDFLKKIVAERGAKPVHEAPFTLEQRRARHGSTSCCSGPKSTDEHLRSYVNGIPTGSGGTHENGLRAGLGKAVRNYIDTHNLSPKGVTLTAEDIREGLTGVLSLFIQEPQFQGQTKDRLNNPEVTSAVDSAGAAGARALAESQPQRSPRRSSRASSSRRARARPAAPRRRRSRARPRRPAA